MPWLWLIRAKRWVQHPPSTQRVMLGAAVVALCLAVVFAEWMGWWPEAWQVERVPRVFR